MQKENGTAFKPDDELIKRRVEAYKATREAKKAEGTVYVMSDEHKRKMSEAAKNRPPISEETRAKLRLHNSKPRKTKQLTQEY